MKKKQCRSSDRKTRNRPTQESNHSGQVSVTAETSTQEASVKEEAKYRSSKRKRKVKERDKKKEKRFEVFFDFLTSNSNFVQVAYCDLREHELQVQQL